MKWRSMKSVPRFKKKGYSIPDKYVVLLHDPDNEKCYRVLVGFWNPETKDWQSCDIHADLMRPTHWMPLPNPPR